MLRILTVSVFVVCSLALADSSTIQADLAQVTAILNGSTGGVVACGPLNGYLQIQVSGAGYSSTAIGQAVADAFTHFPYQQPIEIVAAYPDHVDVFARQTRSSKITHYSTTNKNIELVRAFRKCTPTDVHTAPPATLTTWTLDELATAAKTTVNVTTVKAHKNYDGSFLFLTLDQPRLATERAMALARTFVLQPPLNPSIRLTINTADNTVQATRLAHDARPRVVAEQPLAHPNPVLRGDYSATTSTSGTSYTAGAYTVTCTSSSTTTSSTVECRSYDNGELTGTTTTTCRLVGDGTHTTVQCDSH